jgi:hypothetical protein
MPHTINRWVCAWIEPRGEAFEVVFVCLPGGRHVKVARRPAMKRCGSEDEAKGWIKREAAALGFPVEWVEAGRSSRLLGASVP